MREVAFYCSKTQGGRHAVPAERNAETCVVFEHTVPTEKREAADWATTNAAQIMQRSRVEIAATAEERIAQALESQEITNDNLEETLRFEMTLGTVPVVKSPKNTTKNMNAYRGPEKWTNGSRDWEPPHDRSDVEPLMLETGKLTKPGLYSARRTSPRWGPPIFSHTIFMFFND